MRRRLIVLAAASWLGAGPGARAGVRCPLPLRRRRGRGCSRCSRGAAGSAGTEPKRGASAVDDNIPRRTGPGDGVMDGDARHLLFHSRSIVPRIIR